MNQKNKGFIGIGLILAIILGIVVVGGGAYYLGENSSKQEVNNPENILQSDGISSLEELNKVVNDKFPELSKSWEEKGFNVLMFKKENESSIVKEEYPYNRDENKLRESIYIYSPNKTKIIDPKGGMELFEKDGKIVEAYDVDSSIKLIDLKTNKWKQIASCGTPCGFNDVAWVNDNIFIVQGSYRGLTKDECDIYTECTKATLYVYDLSKNTVTLYLGPAISLGLPDKISKINYSDINSSSKVISTALPSKYISSQDGIWPPVIKNLSITYSCSVSDGFGDVPTVVKEKIINGSVYCVKTFSEGAAGSSYTNYTYIKKLSNLNNTKSTTFILRYDNCSVYQDNSSTGGVGHTECKSTQTNFNSNLDLIVDSLM